MRRVCKNIEKDQKEVVQMKYLLLPLIVSGTLIGCSDNTETSMEPKKVEAQVSEAKEISQEHRDLIEDISSSKSKQNSDEPKFLFTEKEKGVLYSYNFVGKLNQFGFIDYPLAVNTENKLLLYFWGNTYTNKNVEVVAVNPETSEELKVRTAKIQTQEGHLNKAKPEVLLLNKKKVVAENRVETQVKPTGFAELIFVPKTKGMWKLEIRVDNQSLGSANIEAKVSENVIGKIESQ
jgi:hypothetical protein